MPFGVSIYRTGCPNFIAFVLKIGLEYVKASFNNNYDKHAVLELGADSPVPVSTGCFPWSSSGFRGWIQKRGSPWAALISPPTPTWLCLGSGRPGMRNWGSLHTLRVMRESEVELNLLHTDCSDVSSLMFAPPRWGSPTQGCSSAFFWPSQGLSGLQLQ